MYYYSASNNAFYSDELKKEYEDAGSWPNDLKNVSDADYYKIFNSLNADKVLSNNGDGYPILIDQPPLTKLQLIKQAEVQKSNLMKIANNVITPLVDAVDLDIATADERISLLAWKKYRVMVNRIQPNSAPNIIWPDVPKRES
ncbi:tail fiber assembly protein [Rosenbergiella australiborealis]|uniref:tail fiber assembly protein n=1 Tax=Rosenbergiella australiborealis TaxID=1544696 RepID=UPI001F4E85A2|nr:tail fiber assembly protein [Rosenbergiella australiborealis]